MGKRHYSEVVDVAPVAVIIQVCLKNSALTEIQTQAIAVTLTCSTRCLGSGEQSPAEADEGE